MSIPVDVFETCDISTELEVLGPDWLDYADIAIKAIGVVALLVIALNV